MILCIQLGILSSLEKGSGRFKWSRFDYYVVFLLYKVWCFSPSVCVFVRKSECVQQTQWRTSSLNSCEYLSLLNSFESRRNDHARVRAPLVLIRPSTRRHCTRAPSLSFRLTCIPVHHYPSPHLHLPRQLRLHHHHIRVHHH
jgi:hypothetical protein